MELKRLGHAFNRILDASAVLGMAIIAFMMLAVCAAVILRYFIEPLNWVVDVCAILLLCITFLPAAWLQRRGKHVKIDLLLKTLSPRTQLSLNILISIIGIIVFLTITWYGLKATLVYWELGYWMPTPLKTPQFLVLAIIPLGSLLLSIQLLRDGYLLIKKLSLNHKDKL